MKEKLVDMTFLKREREFVMYRLVYYFENSLRENGRVFLCLLIGMRLSIL